MLGKLNLTLIIVTLVVVTGLVIIVAAMNGYDLGGVIPLLQSIVDKF